MNKPRKAVFLDRDGVINKKRDDYVKTIKELQIFDSVAKPIKKLKENGFLVIVVTNQSAINRGLTTHDNINEIHLKIQQHLHQNGVLVDQFYYCPHTPQDNCDCRKPKPGLLLKAINELKIEPRISWMIGDSDSDIEAAKSIECNTIKIDEKTDLNQAVEIILNSGNLK